MMWGDRSPRAKLTGDSRRGFEAVLIGDCRSFRSLARNWPLRLLRLLQQYRRTANIGELSIRSTQFEGDSSVFRSAENLRRAPFVSIMPHFGSHYATGFSASPFQNRWFSKRRTRGT